MKKILMVLTSVSEIGDTGERTGYNVAEAAHPWKVFKDSGHFVDFASIQGGQPPRDEVQLLGLRTGPQPTGRGVLVHRRLGTVPVQLARQNARVAG